MARHAGTQRKRCCTTGRLGQRAFIRNGSHLQALHQASLGAPSPSKEWRSPCTFGFMTLTCVPQYA
eukprot:217494-Pleurochrysis_carterae.AAC.1